MIMLIDKYLPADYSDFCSKSIDARQPITVDTVFDSMFCNFPRPIRILLKARDAVVKPLGLKTGTSFRNRIIERNDKEIVIGDLDKHLNFWVSVYCSLPEEDMQTVSVRTIVSFNNMLGKLYFAGIWVFHKMIVNILFNRTLNKIR